MNKNNFFVLVTVPHAECPVKLDIDSRKKHVCDFRASKIADLLGKQMNTQKISYQIIKSNVLRSVVDMNRDEADLLNSDNNNATAKKEWDSFQYQIKAAILENSSKDILLLDLHSFDKIDSFCKDKSKTDCYITILDIQKQRRQELYDFATKVSQQLGFTVYMTNGGSNYIINTYGNIQVKRPNSLYPILLEFFENKTELTDHKIEEFFEKLLEWFTPLVI
jgi:N-formylglutamate amidohydrolase